MYVSLDHPYNGRTWGLAGVVSRSLKKTVVKDGKSYQTCDTSQPAVFTNVLRFTEWLTTKLRKPALKVYRRFVDKIKIIIKNEEIVSGFKNAEIEYFVSTIEQRMSLTSLIGPLKITESSFEDLIIYLTGTKTLDFTIQIN